MLLGEGSSPPEPPRAWRSHLSTESGPLLVSDHTHLHLGFRNFLSQEVLDAEKPSLFPHEIMVLIS